VFKAISTMKPTAAQFLGDMSDDGQPVDLDYGPINHGVTRLAVPGCGRNHEISQGALPENGNFAADFGRTHYAYQLGGAQWIVTDSAHGGLCRQTRSASPTRRSTRGW